MKHFLKWRLKSLTMKQDVSGMNSIETRIIQWFKYSFSISWFYFRCFMIFTYKENLKTILTEV